MSKPKDRHKSGMLVRIPARLLPPLAALKAKNRRPYTTEVAIAIESHLKTNGVKIPEGRSTSATHKPCGKAGFCGGC